MPIDLEEFKGELENNEEFRNQVIDSVVSNETYRPTITDKLKVSGLEVYDEQSKKALLDRYREDVFNKELPNKVKEIHGQYDETLKKFGIERQQDEKTYAALERGLKERQSTIESLKSQSGGDEELRKKIEEIENNSRKTIAEKDQAIQELQNKYATTEKRIELEKKFSPIKAKFKQDLPGYFKSHEENVINNVLARSVIKNGEMYMSDEQGNVLNDSSFNPIKVEDYLNDQFKDVFRDDKKPAGGAGGDGGDPNNEGDPTKITVDNFVMPGNIKTKVELQEYMSSKGLIQNTKEYRAIWGKHSANLPLR